jgi:hypothetical protein
MTYLKVVIFYLKEGTEVKRFILLHPGLEIRVPEAYNTTVMIHD